MSLFGVLRAPRVVLFGPGQRNALPRLAAELGRRVFLCTDARFHTDRRLSDLAESLRQAGMDVEIYDETLPELPLQCIEEAGARAKRFAPDVVVAVGGGSCIDLGKLVAVRLVFEGPLADLYGEFKVPSGVPPVIAIPTTAGTGSEATPVAVLGDDARTMKVGISSPHLIPYAAICDPELTLTCPPALTATVGADALTHAIEAFTALAREPSSDLAFDHVFVGRNSLSQMLARESIRCLAAHLERAVAEGQDLAAREQVMLGSFLAGQAFGVSGTAAAHAIQYPVGALTHTAHGVGVAVLLPFVMEYNRPACLAEFAEIARLFGINEAGSDEALSHRAIDAIDGLFARIGLPRTLADLGVGEADLDRICEQSLSIERLMKNNPRPLARDSLAQLLAAAYSGNRALLRN
ncbi:iron-containing alcohol dehydrogenase [Chelatococcus sp. GCM10030263]|uniref:iron-containing alcohol dehydrogenase n=1 Tax=Chelatococcus sp. GCM10030263 TaxID=3273387 RepID=UPI00361412B0